MPFSNEEKEVINNLCQFNEYRSRKTLTKFSKKNSKKEGLDTTRNTRETKSNDRSHKSGRPKHVLAKENVTSVEKLVGLLSQEDQPQTHRSTH